MKRSARFPWLVIFLLAASTLLMLAFTVGSDQDATCMSNDPVLEAPQQHPSDLLFELLPSTLFSQVKF